MKIHVPSALREHTGGAASVALSVSGPVSGDVSGDVSGVAPGATVADALQALFEQHPGLRDRLLTEQGHLRPHVALFVGGESIRHTGGFDTPVEPTDELTILPAVSGG